MTGEEFAQRIIAMTDTLYRVSVTQLFRACDREDAVQETLRRAWEKRDKLRNERYLQTWVIRILLNVCHDVQRANRRCVPTEEVVPPSAAEKNAEESELLWALRTLDERYRAPLVLHCIEGYPVATVAAMLRLPQGTVKSRMARGRDKLKAMLCREVFGNENC